MKRLIGTLALVVAPLTFPACDNPDISLVYRGLIAPDDDCVFDVGNPVTSDIDYDPAIFESLHPVALMENNLGLPSLQVDEDDGEFFRRDSSVFMEAFQYAFECDPSLFAGAQTLLLPVFGATDLPFCRDPRDDNAEFIGFDSVQVDGRAIDDNGGQTPVPMRVISPELSSAFRELFTLATAADECCRDLSGDPCGNGDFTNLPMNDQCELLENELASDDIQTSQVDAIRQFAKFSIYGSEFWLNGDTTALNTGYVGPYSLGIRGNFIATATNNRRMTSTEVRYSIQLCGGCVFRGLDLLAQSGDAEALEEARTRVGCFQR